MKKAACQILKDLDWMTKNDKKVYQDAHADLSSKADK
jgi:hypothetical protein